MEMSREKCVLGVESTGYDDNWMMEVREKEKLQILSLDLKSEPWCYSY